MKAHLTTGPAPDVAVGVDIPPTELLEPFLIKIGGLIMLSLDDDDLLLGSAASMFCTFLLTYAASSHCYKHKTKKKSATDGNMISCFKFICA